MSVCKKKRSPYYWTRFTECGIRVQESTRFTTRAEARAYEEKRRNEIKKQFLLGLKPNKTWKEAVVKWTQVKKKTRSFENELSHIKWLDKFFGDKYLHEINEELLGEVSYAKEEEGVKPATINKMLSIISSLLNKAHRKWKWIDRVPTITKLSDEEGRIRWITKKEASILINTLPAHLKAMVRFSLSTGLRASNVKNLRWSEISMEERHLVIHADQSKNKKALGIPLNEDAITVLREQLGKHDEYVFTYQGNRIKQCNTKAWKNALRRAGIENFRWHDLRHTWASWHVQNGTSLHELFELGGWSSFRMVLRYAHLSSAHLKSAANRIGTLVVHSSL